MGIKDNIEELKTQFNSLFGVDTEDSARCTFCGRSRSKVAVLCGSEAGYACSDCGLVLVATFAGQHPGGHGPYLANALRETLGTLDPKTPFSQLDPLFDAALLLANGDTTFSAHLVNDAFRFGYHAKAAAILARVPRAARSSNEHISLLAVALVLNDRPTLRDTFADVEKLDLTVDDQLFVHVHRAYAAFRLDTPGEPVFTADPAMLPSVLARARQLGNDGLVGQILEVTAAFECSRDRERALAYIDEAIRVSNTASKHVLRGDIAFGQDPASARASWEKAIEMSNPDGVWAQRAHARLAKGADDPSSGRSRAGPTGDTETRL